MPPSQKSAVEACPVRESPGADGGSERGELLRTLKRLVSGGAWSDKPEMDDEEAVVEPQRISDSQVVSPTASAQRDVGGATVKPPLASPRVQRTEERTGRPHRGSPYGDSPHGNSQHGNNHAVTASAEPQTGAAAAASSPLSRVGACVGGKKPSRTASSLSEESVYPSPELFLHNESRRGAPTGTPRTQVGSGLEESMAGTVPGGDQGEGKEGGVARASKGRESTEAVVHAATLGGALSAADPKGWERTAASTVTAEATAETAVGATTAVTKNNQESEAAGECQLADTMPPSAHQRLLPSVAGVSSDKAYPSLSMYAGTLPASRTPDVLSAAGSQDRSGVKAGAMPDDDGASDVSESQPGKAAQATTVAQEVMQGDNVIENRDIVANSSAVAAATLTRKPPPSPETITRLSGGTSSDTTAGAQHRGANVATACSPVERGTIIRKPFCLSPANVAAQVSGPHGRAAAPSSCEERERLAARIQLSASTSGSIDTETGMIVNAPRSDARSPLSSPNSPARFGGLNADVRGGNGGSLVSGRGTLSGGGEDGGGKGFVASAGSPSSDNARFRRAVSPERGWLAGGEGFSTASAGRGVTGYENEGGGVGNGGVRHRDGAGEGTHVSPSQDDHLGGDSSRQGSSPPLRFHLPSSVTKTAPLCSAGGSTLLREGELHNAVASGGRGEGAWCFLNAPDGGTRGRQGEAQGAVGDGAEAVKEECQSPARILQPEEEQLVTVRAGPNV